MRSRKIIDNTQEKARLLDTDELRAYLNLGRNSAMKVAENAGAKVLVGRRVLWDRRKLDEFLDGLTR